MYGLEQSIPVKKNGGLSSHRHTEGRSDILGTTGSTFHFMQLGLAL